MSKEKTYIKCNCGCSIIEITKWQEDDSIEYFFTTYELSGAKNLRGTIKFRMRSAWKMLYEGKVYDDHICLSKNEIEELIKDLQQLTK